MRYVYFIIPVINGEINGEPIFMYYLDYDNIPFVEYIVYRIDLKNMEVVDFND